MTTLRHLKTWIILLLLGAVAIALEGQVSETPLRGTVPGPPLPPAAILCRPNGWSSYNDYRGDIDVHIPATNVGNYYQAYITNLAAVWLTNGMYAAGFKTFWLDDGWQAVDRDGNGNLQPNPQTLTNGGVQGLTAVLHKLGYRVVLYTAYGPDYSITYGGFPGTSDATLQRDLNLFATWGVDGIEFDGGGGSDVRSLSGGMVNDPDYTYTRHEFASIDSALGKVTPAHAFWTLVVLAVWPPPPDTPFHCNACAAWGAPGAWGFPDTVDHIVGDFRFIQRYASAWDSENFVMYGEAMGESAYYVPPQLLQAGMTMCALAGSMMRTSGGLGPLSQYYTNQEITPLISDPYAKCGREVFTNNLQEVFVRPLGHANSGTNLVGIYNGASTNQTITLGWGMLGIPDGETLSFRDLWAGTNFMHDNTNLTVSVSGNTIMLFKEWPSCGLRFGDHVTGACPTDAAACRLTLVQLGNGTNRILVSGIPGMTYAIQCEESLVTSNWQSLAVGTAGAQGIFQYDDALPQGTRTRSYRAVAQAGGNPGPAPFSSESISPTHWYDWWRRPPYGLPRALPSSSEAGAHTTPAIGLPEAVH